MPVVNHHSDHLRPGTIASTLEPQDFSLDRWADDGATWLTS